MYHSPAYLPSRGDKPHAHMSGMDDDIPILELESGKTSWGLSLQFDIDTPERTDDTVMYLRTLVVEATGLIRMIEAQKRAAS
jgi:hypothetical protein